MLLLGLLFEWYRHSKEGRIEWRRMWIPMPKYLLAFHISTLNCSSFTSDVMRKGEAKVDWQRQCGCLCAIVIEVLYKTVKKSSWICYFLYHYYIYFCPIDCSRNKSLSRFSNPHPWQLVLDHAWLWRVCSWNPATIWFSQVVKGLNKDWTSSLKVPVDI